MTLQTERLRMIEQPQGIRRGIGARGLQTPGSGVRVRLRAADAGGVRLPPSGQGGLRLCAAVRPQGDGNVVGAADAARRPSRRDRRRGGPARAFGAVRRCSPAASANTRPMEAMLSALERRAGRWW